MKVKPIPNAGAFTFFRAPRRPAINHSKKRQRPGVPFNDVLRGAIDERNENTKRETR